jgi:site-specific recombinase XerD
MSTSTLSTTLLDDAGWRDALDAAVAFLAGFRSAATRKGYHRDLACWLQYCAAQAIHPYAGIRRTHVEVYLRQLEQQVPALANSAMRRRISTLSSWFTWLKDEEISVGNPAARVRRPRRHTRPQPWLDRNELTDLLAAAETEGGYAYPLVCLLGLNGLRVSEACSPDVGDLGGARYQPTLRIIGKGDKPAEIPLNPCTHEAIDLAVGDRTDGPLLLNRWGNRMQRHNAATVVTRLARGSGSDGASRLTRCAAPTSPSGCSKASRSARCNARPPHQSRHDRRLRPVRSLLPPRPHLRPDDRHRPLTTSTVRPLGRRPGDRRLAERYSVRGQGRGCCFAERSIPACNWPRPDKLGDSRSPRSTPTESCYCSAKVNGARRSPGMHSRDSPTYSRGRGWVRTSGAYEYSDDVTTPSGHLKQYVYRETSNWVMVVLEQAGVVELDRHRPIKARLIHGF